MSIGKTSLSDIQDFIGSGVSQKCLSFWCFFSFLGVLWEGGWGFVGGGFGVWGQTDHPSVATCGASSRRAWCTRSVVSMFRRHNDGPLQSQATWSAGPR